MADVDANTNDLSNPSREEDIRALLRVGASIRRLEDLYGQSAVDAAAQAHIADERGGDGAPSSSLAPAVLLRATSQRLRSILKNDDVVEGVLGSLMEDPEDEMLMCPLTLMPLRDPVVLSSGFIVDRSTALNGDTGQLRFGVCPFSRQTLEAEVYPLVPLRNRVRKFELERLDRCITVADKFVSAEEWGHAAKVFEIAEEILSLVGDQTYLHRARRLAELERKTPGADKADKALRIHGRLIRAAPPGDVGMLVTEAVEECLRNAEHLCGAGDAKGAKEWLGHGPSEDFFELIHKTGLVEFWSHLKPALHKQSLGCAKALGDDQEVWAFRRRLATLLKDEELATWLASEGLTGSEQELQTKSFDAAIWPTATGVWMNSSMGIALLGFDGSSPEIQCNKDLNPQTGGDHWTELAFKPLRYRHPAYKNTIFSQHGSGTGWEIRWNGQHVELVWTTGNAYDDMSHNEFLNTQVTLRNGQWVHVAVAYESNASQVTLFVNGLAQSKEVFGTFQAASCLPLLGRNPYWSDRYFMGYVAFASGCSELPVPAGGLGAYVSELSRARLQNLREWEVSRLSLTSEEVSDTADHASLCQGEFGRDARVLDWTDITNMTEEEVAAMKNALGITPTYNEKHFFVTLRGRKAYGDNRVFFFEDHNGSPPGNWMVHDQHAGLSLGSWYDISGKVLCVTSNAPALYDSDNESEVSGDENPFGDY